MTRPKIITAYLNPPIPTRQNDWCAHYDGEEEAGMYGWGATEAEAIQDFIDNCQEHHDERLGLSDLLAAQTMARQIGIEEHNPISKD